MELLSKLKGWLKNQLIYFSAREVLALFVIPLIVMPFFGLTGGFLAALAITVPLMGYIGWRKQLAVEDRLLKDYSNEISAQTGVPEKELTRAQLHQVADGDPQLGIPANPVIAQARDMAGVRQTMRVLGIGVSAVVAIGIFLLFAQTEFVQTKIIGQIESLWKQIAPGIPIKPDVLTVMIFSGTLISSINALFDQAAEGLFGLNRKTAHDLIQSIRRDMNRNHTITQERVFGVFVAADAGLSALVEAVYGAPYYRLPADDQQEIFMVYGRKWQEPGCFPCTIAQLTQDLNNKQIEADELAFAVQGRRSGVARLPRPQPREEEKAAPKALAEEIAHGLNGHSKPEPEEQRDLERQQIKERPANDNIPGFAARFVPKDGAAPRKSFAERESAREAARLESEMERG